MPSPDYIRRIANKSSGTSVPLGKIMGRKPCPACNGKGFRSKNPTLSEGIAGEFYKCQCDGGYIYIRAEVPK
jgi:hypothetical protein